MRALGQQFQSALSVRRLEDLVARVPSPIRSSLRIGGSSSTTKTVRGRRILPSPPACRRAGIGSLIVKTATGPGTCRRAQHHGAPGVGPATGRLLGGQVAGPGEVSTRLHAISVALWGGLTVRELAECDLGYAPPLSPLRDPVQLAAAAAVGDAA